MTDAPTLASALVSAVAVVLSPILIGFALSPAEPDLSRLEEQDQEALEASRRVLALSESCSRKVDQIEFHLGQRFDLEEQTKPSATTSTGD
jgi:hypothetical protein